MDGSSEFGRGFLFKKYMEQKFSLDNINVLRADLVQDNERILDMLAERGQELKVQHIPNKINNFINTEKNRLYNSKIVGAFITYRT